MRHLPDRRSIRYALAGAGAALAVVALMAATVSGFPSRPRFQSVTTGTGTAAVANEIRINAGTDQRALHVDGARPIVKFNENEQVADNRLWYSQADGLFYTIRAVDDAENTATNAVVIERSGITIPSIQLNATQVQANGELVANSAAVGRVATFQNTNANGPYFTFSRSGTAFGDFGNSPQIFGGTLDDLAIGTRGTGDFVIATGATATERFRISDTGPFKFSTTTAELENGAPRWLTDETDAPADEKLWQWISVAGDLYGETRTDIDGAGNPWVRVNRTGTTVDLINLTAAQVQVNGAPISGTGAQGTFTASFDTACTTTPTVTYDWTRSGNIVVLYPVATSGFPCTGDSTSFVTTGAPVPAAIRPNTNADLSPHPGYTDNSVSTWAQATVTSGGNISYNKCTALNTTCNGAGWTAALNRSAPTFTTVTYMLGNP